MLLIAVTVAVYLTIVVANLGGYVDDIMRARIDGMLVARAQGGWLQGKSPEAKAEIVEQTTEEMQRAAGLFEPFVVRCFRWLRQGLTLDWGEANNVSVIFAAKYSRDVSTIILDALPRTLLIFGTANLCLFCASVFLALALTRKHGSWLDRAVVALSPLSATPAWIVGILLNVLFFRALGVISWGGTFDSWPDEFAWGHIPHLLK